MIKSGSIIMVYQPATPSADCTVVVLTQTKILFPKNVKTFKKLAQLHLVVTTTFAYLNNALAPPI